MCVRRWSEGVGQPLVIYWHLLFAVKVHDNQNWRKKVLRKADFSCQRDWPLSEPSWWLELVTYWSALNSSPLLNSAVYCKHHAGLRTVTHKLIKSLLVNCCLCRVRKLWIHQKYFIWVQVDERKSYGFGTTWRWVIYERIFIFGWTIPLRGPRTVEHWLHSPSSLADTDTFFLMVCCLVN